MKRRLLVVILLGAIITSICFAGCNSNVSNRENDKVVLVLDWLVNTNHTGIFVAKELKYFEDQSIDIEIIQAPEMNFIEMTGAGARE